MEDVVKLLYCEQEGCEFSWKFRTQLSRHRPSAHNIEKVQKEDKDTNGINLWPKSMILDLSMLPVLKYVHLG